MAPTLTALTRPTRCPVGCAGDADAVLYPANFNEEHLTAEIFSARRRPDRVHYRMVRCGHCGLVRSNPILGDEAIAALYAASHFTYQDTAPFTAACYLHYLGKTPHKGRLLEIGCGNGFFLERARALGFDEVWGVEPGAEAVAQASPAIRPFLKQGMFTASLFEPASFDVITAFQVLDHFIHPGQILDDCRTLARPGAHLLFICHDLGSAPGRWLGERNPMVDIEHIHLFDQRTIARLFESRGFVVKEVFPVKNTYPLGYWARLFPLPGPVKTVAEKALALTGLGRVPLSLKAGNLGIVAVAP